MRNPRTPMPRPCKPKSKIRLSSSVLFASLQAFVAVLALVIPLAGNQATQTPPPAPAKKTTKATTSKSAAKAPDTVPDGPPMVMNAIIQMLERVKAGTMVESRVIAFINKRGLDFVATSDNLGKLKDAGASVDLVDVINLLKP